MPLDFLQDSRFAGPALPEPFVRFELEKELNRLGLLPREVGKPGGELQESWGGYRRTLRELIAQGGPLRIRNHVTDPLVKRLGYETLEEEGEVETREGREAGGSVMQSNGSRLRTWAVAFGEDLDAPARRGRAYRFSHTRIAERVLLARGERAGLLTNGIELRLLISDPARPGSQIIITLDPYWKRSRAVPDSYRLLLALASPKGLESLADIIEKARLQQTRVTRELRRQAREAVEAFLQEVLDHPANRERLAALSTRTTLARELWHEGLITVYRLLFILKLESSDDPARAFGFASTGLWRNTFSPSVALAPIVRAVLDGVAETGSLLEDGLRQLFRIFAKGIECTELNVRPLGGALFGDNATPLLSELRWGERAVARLIDRLLWTSQHRGGIARQRVHYGPLDVEDLGRVYEALLELEPGISSVPMCRLRRQKLEVVVPLAQGERYRPAVPSAADVPEEAGDEETTEDDEPVEDAQPEGGKKTRVEWIEEIPPGRFYLRVGLGRKASGSYYTPHSFVRFLVQETLGPQVAERSPHDNPRPSEILKLRVLDPAMGSGHFLVEACRFLGDKLYEACRLCDEKASEAERTAERAKTEGDRETATRKAAEWRIRVQELPDPEDELLRYLPSRSVEGEESGYSVKKAEALCRRLVAVHCLYGVDKNPLAVELDKVTLWIESHAEGLPLTFLDHRLLLGDSLTGPFFEHMLKFPGSQEPMDDLYTQGLRKGLTRALADALKQVGDLEASIGISLSEDEMKRHAKARLDGDLAPLKILAAAWAGGVMLGSELCDDNAYAELARRVAETGDLPESLDGEARLLLMIGRGLGVETLPAKREELLNLAASGICVPALPYELAFPEVFVPASDISDRHGFDAVLGNPPWDRMLPADKEFFAAHEFRILDAATKREREAIQQRLLADHEINKTYVEYIESFRGPERLIDALYVHQVAIVDGEGTIGKQDIFRLFMERNAQLLHGNGYTGVVVPSAFHANEGATGIRQLYLEKMALRCCYSFENRRQLFEIHRSFKFALVVATRGSQTDAFSCAFYLHDDEWLFGDRTGREPLRYAIDFVRRTGGDYLTLLELRSPTDLEIAEICFKNGEPFGKVCARLGIRLGRELNMTDDAWRFTPTRDVLPGGEDPRDPEVAKQLLERGYLVLHEGKTFHQFTDRWGERPRYLVAPNALNDKLSVLRAVQFYRFAYRDISRSTDERTVMFSLLPPAVVFGDTAKAPERQPWSRANAVAIRSVAVANTYVFDYLARLRVAAHVSLFVIESLPMPSRSGMSLIHLTLRLLCNSFGYAPLWHEQLGDAWREPKPPFTWPVVVTDDERWEVRAAIDAVVADAYGLTRDQYAHVLSAFSHKSYPRAPELCLAWFDELKLIGIEAFTRKHDPYWDIPLNENLPQPVIELPAIHKEENTSPSQLSLPLMDDSTSLSPKKQPARRRKVR